MTGSARRAATGMMLMTLAMQIVPFSDACAKLLSANYGMPPMQAAWARIVFAALFLLPAAAAMPRTGKALAKTVKPYFWRGAFWAGATAFFFAALKDNPLPSALALLFVAPLFVAAAAPVFLGERFSARRAVCSAAGFGGVLLVLSPATGTEFNPSLLWALAAGLCYGGYLMAARRGGELRGGSATFMTMLVAAVLVAPFALWQWRAPDGTQWALMAAMGGLSAAGHFLITKACEYADASQVAPFNYAEIIGASAASYWLFSELPPPQVYAGIAVIAAAGVYVALSDLRAQK